MPSQENVSVAGSWLSVVMPTYNGARYLPAALESIVAQADESIEVIAVDDGSTDATLPILESFARRIRLKILRRPHTGNWVSSTNCGIGSAAGEFVCCLAQDDVWEPNRLAVLRAAAARDADVTLVIHAAWYIDASGNRLGRWHCPLPAGRGPLDSGVVTERLLVQNFIALPAALFRRDAALRVGGMDERLWYAADWDFWLKLAAAGKVLYIAEPLARFRLHAGSQTQQRTARAGDVRRQLEAVLERHLARCTNGLAQRATIQRAARFSIRLNAALAEWLHGDRPDWAELLRSLSALRLAGAYRYLRDSRIVERVAARVRCGLWNGRPGGHRRKLRRPLSCVADVAASL